MDKTRKNDVFNFIRTNDYNILRIYSQDEANGKFVFELQGGTTSGLVGCYVTNTEFYLSPNVGSTIKDLDWSESWMNYLLKEHPEMAGSLIAEMETRINEFKKKSSERLGALRAEYQREYDWVCAEENRLQNIKSGLVERVIYPEEKE